MIKIPKQFDPNTILRFTDMMEYLCHGTVRRDHPFLYVEFWMDSIREDLLETGIKQQLEIWNNE